MIVLCIVFVCYKNSQHLAAAQVLGFKRKKKLAIPCSEELPLWVDGSERAGGLWLECLTAASSDDALEKPILKQRHMSSGTKQDRVAAP